MVLIPLDVTIGIDSLICHDKGNDPGPRAEPYLWTVFFTVDGSTASLSVPDFTLSGHARVVPTPGDHGDLGVVEVSSGQTVQIPDAIGHFQTVIRAIPVSPTL